MTLSNSRRVLIPSTVERQGRGSTPLYVVVYGVEGDVAGQVQQDFYVFARSPLFRSLYRYLYSFFVEVSHITLTTGHLLQSMTTGLPFVMQIRGQGVTPLYFEIRGCIPLLAVSCFGVGGENENMDSRHPRTSMHLFVF